MTISNPSNVSGPFYPDGVATTFPFDFAAMSASELAVLQNGLPLAAGLYSANLDGEGGSVTFTDAPLSGSGPILIAGDPDFTQGVQTSATLLPGVISKALDRATARDIALRATSVMTPVGEGPAIFPSRAARAGRALMFDAGGAPAAYSLLPTSSVVANTLSGVNDFSGQTFSTSVVCLPGTVITATTAVTFNGGFTAPRMQVFATGASVVFGPGQDVVLPEWFGAVGVAQGATAPSTAQQAINTTAFNAAVLASPAQCDVVCSGVDYWHDDVIWACRKDQQGFRGQGENATRFILNHATHDQFRFGGAGVLINEPRWGGLSAFRAVAQTFTLAQARDTLGLFTDDIIVNAPVPSDATHIAAGFRPMYLANPIITPCRVGGHMVGAYWKHTTGVRPEAVYVTSPSGAVAYGHYFEGRGVALAGTSMNGSLRSVHPLVHAVGSTTPLYAYVLDGRAWGGATPGVGTGGIAGDIRDIWLIMPETAGVAYPLRIASAADMDWDIVIDTPIFDLSWGAVQSRINNGGRTTSITLSGPGWLTSNGDGTGNTILLQLDYAHGVTVSPEITFLGGPNYANCTGIDFNHATNCRAGGAFRSCNYGVVVDASLRSTVLTSTFDNFPGQGGTARILVENGSDGTTIQDQVMDGDATYGVSIDSTCTRSRTGAIQSGSGIATPYVQANTTATGAARNLQVSYA